MTGQHGTIRVVTRAGTWAGLLIAWGGTALLISPAARALGDPTRLTAALIGQAAFWCLGIAVIAIVRLWEKQPLASIWLRPFRLQSIAWGMIFVAVFNVVLLPIDQWVRRRVGLSGFAAGMEQIMKFPLWYRVIAVVGAGVVEEILFRGFTVTRLAALTGNVWIAAMLALLGFSALHVPAWGWGFALGGLVSGVATMAFFIWRKDLLAMMVFHTIVDATGIVIAPTFSEWWTESMP